MTVKVVEAYLGRFSVGSKPTVAKSLKRIVNILEPSNNIYDFKWQNLQIEDIHLIKSSLQNSNISYQTANLSITFLRGILEECNRFNLITENKKKKLSNIDNIKGFREETGTFINKDIYQNLINLCASDVNKVLGIRDSLIISLLYTTGVRRSEAVSIKIDDIKGDKILITGKGNKQRFIFLTQQLVTKISSWLNYHGKDGFLFSHLNNVNKSITSNYLFKIIEKRFNQIGITDLSPHDFRRTFITNLLNSGVDVITVSQLAGHSSVHTTARYDKRPEEFKKSVINKLFPGD